MGVIQTLALAALLAQAAPGHQPPAPQTDQTVPVQRGNRLSINNFAGEVVLHTWDKDSLHVVARHQTRTRVVIRTTGAAVSLSGAGAMGPAGSIDYDITAPAWMPVRVEGTYNFVTIEGAQAEVSVESVRGDIAIKGGSGLVTAKSTEGAVSVEGARGKVTASSINEGVKVTDTSGDIVAETINGSIKLSKVDSKSVDVSTVNGDVTFDGTLLDGGHYSFSTHNGDISLEVPEHANATFGIRTYNGDFTTDLPMEGINKSEMHRGKRMSLTLGSGSADVNLETFGGTIKVRKTAAVRNRRQEP
jgi:DUF4097 and DUF4098 domain-containing protein YvlB